VERIVEAAIVLLNREGGAQVTTNHIAAHLGMSPGNLYYHFRNREEIIRAIFPRIVAAGTAATARPEAGEITAREFGERHVAGLEILWEYRFFYRDLNLLLARDARLAAAYREYLENLGNRYLALFEQLVAQGVLRRPTPASDLQRLVTDSIVIWFNWIAFLAATRGPGEIDRADAAEGALHSFLVVAPHLDPGFARAARAVIARHGGGSA
jgi:AcrR family transcriptional regulator